MARLGRSVPARYRQSAHPVRASTPTVVTISGVDEHGNVISVRVTIQATPPPAPTPINPPVIT